MDRGRDGEVLPQKKYNIYLFSGWEIIDIGFKLLTFSAVLLLYNSIEFISYIRNKCSTHASAT